MLLLFTPLNIDSLIIEHWSLCQSCFSPPQAQTSSLHIYTQTPSLTHALDIVGRLLYTKLPLLIAGIPGTCYLSCVLFQIPGRSFLILSNPLLATPSKTPAYPISTSSATYFNLGTDATELESSFILDATRTLFPGSWFRSNIHCYDTYLAGDLIRFGTSLTGTGGSLLCRVKGPPVVASLPALGSGAIYI